MLNFQNFSSIETDTLDILGHITGIIAEDFPELIEEIEAYEKENNKYAVLSYIDSMLCFILAKDDFPELTFKQIKEFLEKAINYFLENGRHLRVTSLLGKINRRFNGAVSPDMIEYVYQHAVDNGFYMQAYYIAEECPSVLNLIGLVPHVDSHIWIERHLEMKPLGVQEVLGTIGRAATFDEFCARIRDLTTVWYDFYYSQIYGFKHLKSGGEEMDVDKIRNFFIVMTRLIFTFREEIAANKDSLDDYNSTRQIWNFVTCPGQEFIPDEFDKLFELMGKKARFSKRDLKNIFPEMKKKKTGSDESDEDEA
jgi:hypothetical protein